MKKIVQIILGNILIAFAFSALILEHGIIAGGASGLGNVLNHYMGLSISLCVGVINVSLFIIGFLFIGKEFAAKTILSTFLFPILLEFFNNQPIFHNLLSDSFFACILGGILVGTGVGLILKAGGSTGGFDIIGILAEKHLHIPTTIVFNGIDLTILLLQCLFHQPEQIIYGIVTVMLTAYMMNQALMSGKGLAQVMIMSDKYNELHSMILNELNAGVTLLQAEKGYTSHNTKVLLSAIPYRKLPDFKEQIKNIDEKAFIIVSKIEEVGGNDLQLR